MMLELNLTGVNETRRLTGLPDSLIEETCRRAFEDVLAQVGVKHGTCRVSSKGLEIELYASPEKARAVGELSESLAYTRLRKMCRELGID